MEVLRKRFGQETSEKATVVKSTSSRSGYGPRRDTMSPNSRTLVILALLFAVIGSYFQTAQAVPVLTDRLGHNVQRTVNNRRISSDLRKLLCLLEEIPDAECENDNVARSIIKRTYNYDTMQDSRDEPNFPRPADDALMLAQRKRGGGKSSFYSEWK